jgi:hypothetical protein
MFSRTYVHLSSEMNHGSFSTEALDRTLRIQVTCGLTALVDGEVTTDEKVERVGEQSNSRRSNDIRF